MGWHLIFSVEPAEVTFLYINALGGFVVSLIPIRHVVQFLVEFSRTALFTIARE